VIIRIALRRARCSLAVRHPSRMVVCPDSGAGGALGCAGSGGGRYDGRRSRDGGVGWSRDRATTEGLPLRGADGDCRCRAPGCTYGPPPSHRPGTRPQHGPLRGPPDHHGAVLQDPAVPAPVDPSIYPLHSPRTGACVLPLDVATYLSGYVVIRVALGPRSSQGFVWRWPRIRHPHAAM
jgi:hypothetical protein